MEETSCPGGGTNVLVLPLNSPFAPPRSEMEDGMSMLEALPAVVRGGLVKAAKQCGAGVLADAGAMSYPSQRCLFGNKRADSGEAGTASKPQP